MPDITYNPTLTAYANAHGINTAVSCPTATYNSSAYDASYNLNLCQNDTVIRAIGDDIDTKTREIYQSPGSVSHSFNENYQTTMMVGVIWAMLGTTVLYYTFSQL